MVCGGTEIASNSKLYRHHRILCDDGGMSVFSTMPISLLTVKRALNDLEKAGLVEKSNRWQENGSLTSNLYRIK